MDGKLGYAWYGDDFTGASDTLATAAQAGVRAMLFCGVPTDDQFRRAGALDAFGIAGAARSMAPHAMRAELGRVAPFLRASGARVLHYKCCSTFDSAPHVGSIGVAVEALRGLAPDNPVLILGGQPSLGRYCVFGELYAVAARGGPVYRIDRHPTMSRHPVTPMQEADLRLHLAAQGLRDVGLVDVRAHEQASGFDAALDRCDAGATNGSPRRVVLLDVAADSQLETIGAAMRGRAQQAPLLVVGASSVAQALIDHARLPRRARDAALGAASEPVFVLAGSLSPVTARQIERASGYTRVALAPEALANDATYLATQARRIATVLRAGQHVLAHTTPVGDQTSVAGVGGKSPSGSSTGQHAANASLAEASAALLHAVLRSAPVKRVGIAGGDTSSRAVQSLAAWGLEWIGQVDNGVPLLRAHADDPAIDGLQLMLKGGQMGSDDLFDVLIRGAAAPAKG